MKTNADSRMKTYNLKHELGKMEMVSCPTQVRNRYIGCEGWAGMNYNL